MADKFLIAPLNSGLQSNLKPWLILDESFANLRNMYTWRGSVKKRFGGRVMNGSKSLATQQQFTRFRINLGNTAAVSGNFSVTVPGAIFAIGQMFSIGTTYFTVDVTGTPATLLTTGSATGTYNTTTGALVITGNTENPTTAVFFYPATPVMGLDTYNLIAVNNEQLFGFDTQFAYTFGYTTGWSRSSAEASGGASLWHGTNSDFYWSANYRGATDDNSYFFVTNNVAVDAMRYFDGTNWNKWGSAATTPINAANDFIKTCQIIIPFKERLLFMNVTENIGAADFTFINRVRFSKIGDPTAADAWIDDRAGLGGFLDAPVDQAIIDAQFLKDQLIVYFESSTWELVFTGNPNDPFRFQQINTELGVESTFSGVPFDRVVLGIGNIGIHACNGLNVERIDQVIPYTVFDINNANAGPQRVQGIRDYYVELVYWTYNSSSASNGNSNTFPNRVLVYDYIGNTWAYNDDSITALGNYQYQNSFTWADLPEAWEDVSLIWDDPSLTSRFRSVIAGNQEGWTFIADSNIKQNCMALQITNMTVSSNVITVTAINHNLPLSSYVYIQNVVDDGIAGTNLASSVNNIIWNAISTGVDTFTISPANVIVINGTGYRGGGTVQRVSELEILSKQYNFYQKQGKDIAVSRTDFYVDRTAKGQLTVDFYVSSSNQSQLTQAQTTGALIGTNILETSGYVSQDPLLPPPPLNTTLEATQDRFWHYLYFPVTGENIQLKIYLSPQQLLNVDVMASDFQLNAFQIVGQAVGQLGYNITI